MQKPALHHLFSLAVLCCLLCSANRNCAAEINFNSDIRPILSDKCFHCHGPDNQQRQAGLRLDEEAAAHEDVIVVGDAEGSEAYRRLISDDPDQRMPPPGSNKNLSEREIALIREWIDSGAKYESHWAFLSPQHKAPPTIDADRKWIRNPIDAFVLRKLQSKSLSPSPAADKNTLLRRVTLDLTGLPPSAEERRAFLADDSPAAFETVVDRLLESHHYGHRMAQLWLDAARYADTMGYQADWERYQWRWRSWVIDSYNRNQPFDEFTIEQLAGDLLPNPSIDQLIATGFNRNHRINDEGGIIPEEYLVEYIVDRVETTSATWMGLTMGCARCHDHKFDPISQVDFYRFYAFFNAVPEQGKQGRQGFADPYMRVATRGKHAEYEALKAKVSHRELELAAATKTLGESRQRWVLETIQDLRTTPPAWQTPEPSKLSALNGSAAFERLKDGSYRVSGEDLKRPTYVIELSPAQGLLPAIRLEAIPDPSLSDGRLSPGGGNVLLTNFTVHHVKKKGKTKRIKIAKATADYEQKNFPIKHAIDNDKQTAWGVDGHIKKEQRTAEFAFDAPVKIAAGDKLIVRMAFESAHEERVIGRFRLSVGDPAIRDRGLPSDVAAAIRKTEPRSTADQRRIAKYHATVATETSPQRKRVAEALQQQKNFEAKHSTYVMVMREMEKPRDTHVLNRGVYDQPGEIVTAGVPEKTLGGLPPSAPVNRLGLARWLTSGEHPLTARVIVNRYWAMLFGSGLVSTIEDFGLQSEFPSHPELLDWLATEYPRNGWDTKRLLKLMVMSATYQQASRVRPGLTQQDPHNRLLARMSRIRLPAEMIRDQALFASGLLVDTIGGPSVKPYQPEGLWKELSFQDKKRSTDFYLQGSGDDLYRRSIYTFWKRSVPPPTMATFDAPSREICTLSRSRTNTPLQALALMNDTTYVEASRVLAENSMHAGQDINERIDFLFQQLVTRDPLPQERRVLTLAFDSRLSFFSQNKSAAAELIAQGASTADANLDQSELAALTTCAMTVLNLDETVNRE
ncbi:MAG: PSD1 and planctomycete cytochrome C domain-containing protein [Rubripirellula sp.]